MMNVDEKVEYWLDIASYDLKTAQAMLRTKRFLYVGFMCHQVIEKALKKYLKKQRSCIDGKPLSYPGLCNTRLKVASAVPPDNGGCSNDIDVHAEERRKSAGWN